MPLLLSPQRPQLQERQEVGSRIIKLLVSLIRFVRRGHRTLARVLNTERGGDHQHLPQAPLPLTGQNHAGDTRIDRQLGERSANVRKLFPLVDGPQLMQRLIAILDGARIRRFDEWEVLDPAKLERSHLQNDTRKIVAENLGIRELIA